MSGTVKDVMDFIKEKDIKFIRLAFCDLCGMQKSISLTPNALPSAFDNGVMFDAASVRGFSDPARSDLLLFPDPETFTVLSGLAGQGHAAQLFCEAKNPDTSPYDGDSRTLLKRVLERCRSKDYDFAVGAELEFYLFKTDETGEPAEETHDCGGYLDITPLDKCENIRRDICLSLEEMGIYPRSSHHQHGPGQNAIELEPADALRCADNILSSKSVIKAISAGNGLFASFMPKPIPTKSGSGAHLRISLQKNDHDIFGKAGAENMSDAETEPLSAEAGGFISGILSKSREITLFTNPTANSYERFSASEAPKRISWSRQNRAQLIRVYAARGRQTTIELRFPDPSFNPYLAFALIISAGLDGIENSLPLPPEAGDDQHTGREESSAGQELLPGDLCQAAELAGQSGFVKSVLGPEAFTHYMSIKSEEATAFGKTQNKREFFRDKYFKYI